MVSVPVPALSANTFSGSPGGITSSVTRYPMVLAAGSAKRRSTESGRSPSRRSTSIALSPGSSSAVRQWCRERSLVANAGSFGP
jgi:hypothetical protein